MAKDAKESARIEAMAKRTEKTAEDLRRAGNERAANDAQARADRLRSRSGQ